jgi:hypothetical protein
MLRCGNIAGHGRVAAARTLGLREFSIVRLAEMGEAEIRADGIGDRAAAQMTAGAVQPTGCPRFRLARPSPSPATSGTFARTV